LWDSVKKKMSKTGGSVNMFESQRSRIVIEVEQLRTHYRMNRVPLSETLTDLKAYTDQNLANDPLVYPTKENPFKEKKTCTVL